MIRMTEDKELIEIAKVAFNEKQSLEVARLLHLEVARLLHLQKKEFQKKIKDILKELNQTNRKGWSDDTPKDFIDGWNSCIEALKQILKGD